MAGIAGVLGDAEGVLDLMLERIRHRGPHEMVRINDDGSLQLGCNELNIGGGCPDGSHYARDGKRSVVMDGRIYNEGLRVKTDAEAVLELHDRHGFNFAERIDGDFACALSCDGTLILARDETGIKPLYYGHDERGTLCFASEAKALVGISSDVREFPPGYCYSREMGFRKYTCSVETPDFENYEQAKGVVRELLEKATEKRMRDGAVTGVLLSGGLDSSLIASMASKIRSDIECYTVSMEEGEDLPLARDVTEVLGLEHHVRMFGEDETAQILPTAIHHQEMYEESCVHGAIANFIAGQFLQGKASCVLTGEGADEFFAGYDGQYKKGENPEEVAGIIDFIIRVAHNTALQRLDRLNAANGYESRTPFLDTAVMDFSLKIPLDHKIHGPDQVGKWVLRQAFEGDLPDHIIYQTKRFFSQGSGVAYVMRREAEERFSEDDLATFNREPGNPLLSSVEELYYYKIFKETFPDRSFDRLVGRWDPLRPSFFPAWEKPR